MLNVFPAIALMIRRKRIIKPSLAAFGIDRFFVRMIFRLFGLRDFLSIGRIGSVLTLSPRILRFSILVLVMMLSFLGICQGAWLTKSADAGERALRRI